MSIQTYQQARQLVVDSLADGWQGPFAASAEGWETGTAFYVLVGDPRWINDGDHDYLLHGGIVGALVDKETSLLELISSLRARTVARGASRAH